MTPAHKQGLLDAATHWDRLADENEEQARWDVEHGISVGPVEHSAGYHRARDYRRCARTLRMQADTGKPHCMCCERPTERCAFTRKEGA
jgi:hypothetical protein